MATLTPSRRFALRPVFDQALPDGAWWPENRTLSEQFGQLFALWPPDAGRIARILYSPPDWDDQPRFVEVPGRRIKAGSFPRDDTHQLILTMLDRQRLSITVIAPDTSVAEAGVVLDGVSRDVHA
jgi:hypothetical protein